LRREVALVTAPETLANCGCGLANDRVRNVPDVILIAGNVGRVSADCAVVIYVRNDTPEFRAVSQDDLRKRSGIPSINRQEHLRQAAFRSLDFPDVAVSDERRISCPV